MRKGFLIIIASLSLTLLMLIFNGLLKLEEQEKYVDNISYFPELSIYKNDLELNNEELFDNRGALFFILNPDCYYCERQIEDLIKNGESLFHINIYLLIPETKSRFVEWENLYENRFDKNIQFCRIEPKEYLSSFGEMKLPAILYYDTNKRLVSSNESFAKSDWILKNMLADENQ